MDLGKLFRGETKPDPALQRTFSPPGATSFADGAPLRTTIKWGWLKDKLEDVGYIKPEHYERAGIVPGDAALGASQSLDMAPTAALASGTTGAANVGIYDQMLARRHGFQVPTVRPDVLEDAPVAALADDIVDAAEPVVSDVAAAADTPIAAATDKAAAKVAGLEQRFIEGFQRLGTLPAEQRIPTLARAIDAGAAAGHGDDAFGVLATELASRPLEHSVEALHSSIDDAIKAVAPQVSKVAEVVEHAAPVASDAVKAAPVVEEVVAKATPVLDDVVHAAVAVAKPSVIEAVLPEADDALRYGLKGVMSMRSGLDDTMRLLARVHI